MPETENRQLLRNVQNFFRSYLNAFLPAYHPVLADDMVKRRINIMMAAAGILFMVLTSRISEHFEVSASAGYLALTDSLVSILVILSLIQFRGRWSLQIASAAILYYLTSLAADYYLHRMNPPMVYAFFGAIVLALHFLTGRWISLISVAFLSLMIPVIEIVHNKRYLFTDDFKNSKGFFINIAVSGLIIWLIAESYRSALTAVIRKLNAVAKENERDLELSRSIQTGLLPEDIISGPVEMAGYMKSAGKVGGDFYDASQAGGYHWFALGDVTGHGMQAGLVIMQIRSLLSHYLNTRPADLPSDILQSLNNSFYNAMSPLREYYYSYYISITLLRISPEGELLLAGHHPGSLLYRKKKISCGMYYL